MSVCFGTYQTVIQSTSMADFSFGFTKGLFFAVERPKTLDASRRLDK